MKKWLVGFYRVRMVVFMACLVVLVGNIVLSGVIGDGPAVGVRVAAVGVALVLCCVCLVVGFLVPRWLPEPEVRVVMSPVRGRWMGLNSPASKVPSHGIRAYGQAYAIDLVADPLEAPRPDFGGAFMRSSQAYPAFGLPVMAMADGEVVKASDWRRDHRARSNGWGVLYLMIEGMIREVGGPGFIIGNHVVIRTDDGMYAAVAHLQRGSVSVKVGDRVRAGAVIGRCGNSGNSSEPHVHAQLMDRASFLTGQGAPLAFAGIDLESERSGPSESSGSSGASAKRDGLPKNSEFMNA